MFLEVFFQAFLSFREVLMSYDLGERRQESKFRCFKNLKDIEEVYNKQGRHSISWKIRTVGDIVEVYNKQSERSIGRYIYTVGDKCFREVNIPGCREGWIEVECDK